MDKLILSPIEISDLLSQVRTVIQEELQACGISLANDLGSNDKPITTKELCEHLRVSEPTVIRWRTKGKIPYFNIGSAVRFHLKDVIKALENKKR